MPFTSLTFFGFLREIRFAYLAGTSFLLFGMIYGAFEIMSFTIGGVTDPEVLGYLHFSRGVFTTLALLAWIGWTLFEYRGRFQQVLRQHDDRLLRIIDNISEAVIVTNTEGRITFWNQAASNLFGWERDQVLKKPITSIIAVPTGENLLPGRYQEYEIDLQTRSGEHRYVSVVVSSLSDDIGKVESYTYVFHDLTEKAVRMAQMERSERLASLGHMAAGIAHEIGNPLTAISSVVQLLQRRTTDEKQLTQLHRVQENIGRITTIVREMVDFSKPVSTENSKMNLNDSIRDAVGLLKHDTRSRNVRFVLELDQNLPSILAIPDQLHQVMLNLILNAVDAVTDKNKPIVSIRTYSAGGMVCAEVADNGSGIPPNIKNRIFEPFFTTKKVGKGTGLGLSVTHNIITGIGGQITVSSSPGETVFEILIPVAP